MEGLSRDSSTICQTVWWQLPSYPDVQMIITFPHLTRWIQMFHCIFSPVPLNMWVQKQGSSVWKSLQPSRENQPTHRGQICTREKEAFFKKIRSFLIKVWEKSTCVLPLTTIKSLAWEIWKQMMFCYRVGVIFPLLFRHLLKPELDKYFQLKLYSLS